ncbi:MAG: MmcB family DNA repair protein, partial [Hyphomicrobiales bacterium]|nr:MmcB family DNA repair protein [Hyphomicrobiales bacterium]
MTGEPAAPAGRPAATLAISRGARRALRALGLATVAELPLPDGRRADVVALAGDGTLWIAEVKSSPEDFAADRKWGGYSDHCDRFLFAVGEDFPVELIPETCGLMVCDAYDGRLLRDPAERRLAPA